MEIESKQCVILVPPCVTRDTSSASTDASQNQLFYYGTHHQYLHDITNADHDDQKNRMVSGGGRGSGGRVVCRLQWLRKIVENLLLPTNKFLRKASNWNENSPSTTRFFRVLRLSGIISSPCPLSLPFLTLPEVFDITSNQNLQIRTSPLGLLLNISRTA